MRRSYGCELQPKLFEAIDSFKEKEIIDHIQITVPNTIGFETALDFSSKIKTIAHSNVLNVFGNNNWQELEEVSHQIKALKPLHVVEHFTAFRPLENEKCGIYFNLNLKNKISEISDKVKRWQDILGIQVCLENVAVSTDVEAYFDLLLEIKNITQCGIACDLPHFLISMASGKKNHNDISKLAKDLGPKQLHLGGVTISNGLIKDNHKIFNLWINTLGKNLFPDTEFLTLEQNHQISAEVVESNMIKIANSIEDLQEDYLDSCGASPDSINVELANDVCRLNGYPNPKRIIEEQQLAEVTENHQALYLYNKYLPFAFPVASIDSDFSEITSKKAVSSAASLARWALSYLSWWRPNASRYCHLIYGEKGRELFSKVISESPSSDIPIRGSNNFKFISNKDFWVEIATP